MKTLQKQRTHTERFLLIASNIILLLAVPMGLKMSGIVVNKTLLEKEGLPLPTNDSEFLDVCEKLKNAGYTPIQGPNDSVYGELAYNLAMTELGNDPALLEALNNGGFRQGRAFGDQEQQRCAV